MLLSFHARLAMVPCDSRVLNLRPFRPLLLSLLALFASAGSATAQGSISGEVMTEDREPIGGATISVPGTGIGTISGFRGRFRLEGLRVGQYDVVAEAPGYAAVRQTVLVEDGRMSTPVFVLPELEDLPTPAAVPAAFGELPRRPNVLVRTQAYCMQAADTLWLRSTAESPTRTIPPGERVLLVPRPEPDRVLTADDTVAHVRDPELTTVAGCLCGTAERLDDLRAVDLRGYYVPAADEGAFRATFDLVSHGMEEACGG